MYQYDQNSVGSVYRASYASRAGANRPKEFRPGAPGPPKLNRILPFEGCKRAGILASWSVSVSVDVGSV
jgi:hypothetical protein